MLRGILIAAIVLLALPVGANAAVTRKKAIWGPVTVDGRSQFPTYADLGVGIYQHALSWDAVAAQHPANATDPNDPAYNWPAEIDEAIAEGARYGIQVSLSATASRAKGSPDVSFMSAADPRLSWAMRGSSYGYGSGLRQMLRAAAAAARARR